MVQISEEEYERLKVQQAKPDDFHAQHHQTELRIHHVIHLDAETRGLLFLLFGKKNDPAIKAEIGKLKASADTLKQATAAATAQPAQPTT